MKTLLRCVLQRRFIYKLIGFVLLYCGTVCIWKISHMSLQLNPYARKFFMNDWVEVRGLADTEKHANSHDIRFAERYFHLQDACERMKTEYLKGVNHGQCQENALRQHLEYAENSPFLFCPIEKTGSTFWTRLLSVVSGTVNMRNPLDIKIAAAYGKNKNFKSLPIDKVYQLLRTTKKVMFVRDPYSRLFSAYVDKLFNPNPSFWRGLGSRVILSERLKNKKVHITCGYNVTFREFVSFYIKWIRAQACIDSHFSESYRHCHPCEIDFDFIGKMETFKEDTEHILRRLNLSHVINFEDFKRRSDQDVIDDAVNWLFGTKTRTAECVSFKVSMMRVWRRLQIRGILSKHRNFPFTNHNSAEITKQTFQSELERAYFDDQDTDSRQENRLEALREAYSTLSEFHISNLRYIFKVDLELFGYEHYPDYLRRDINYKPDFRYLIV